MNVILTGRTAVPASRGPEWRPIGSHGTCPEPPPTGGEFTDTTCGIGWNRPGTPACGGPRRLRLVAWRRRRAATGPRGAYVDH
jgi:hypothetical protein